MQVEMRPITAVRPYANNPRHNDAAVDAVDASIREYGFRQPLVVDEDGVIHEWCFYGWREGAAHKYFGPNNATDVWSVKKVNPQSMVHLTEKPVELASRAIEYSSKPGENVLDLFGGSGSTLIAAEQAGHKAFLMELDPLYTDVIVQRWEQFTGKNAERAS
jgi:DNA modification methylase